MLILVHPLPLPIKPFVRNNRKQHTHTYTAVPHTTGSSSHFQPAERHEKQALARLGQTDKNASCCYPAARSSRCNQRVNIKPPYLHRSSSPVLGGRHIHSKICFDTGVAVRSRDTSEIVNQQNCLRRSCGEFLTHFKGGTNVWMIRIGMECLNLIER